MSVQVWERPDYSYMRKQIMAAPRQRRYPMETCSFQEGRRACKRARHQSPETQPGKQAKLWCSPGSKHPPAKAAPVPSPLRAEE